MKFDSDIHRRRSIRLKEYDYYRPGAYFVTICTHNKHCLFGVVSNKEIELNFFGRVVVEEWKKTEIIRPYVSIDEFVVMPNHFHGVLVINNGRGTARRAPTEQFGKPAPNSVPTIVRAFKSSVTRRINRLRGTRLAPVWQRNYYEHVIRNENVLNEVREYISLNPLKWLTDPENPDTAATSRSPVPEESWQV